MESNSALIGVGVGALVVVISYILYQKMGCGPSVANSNNKISPKDSAEKPKKKEDSVNKYPAGKLSIYFGSQTGTAEGFARTLMEEGKKTGFDAKIVDLEDFDAEKLRDTTNAIFLMATYGEGEPTDNAAVFAKWFKNEDNSLSKEYLSGLRFSVFGLGNRQYEHYNRMGKITDSSLEALGARRVFAIGEGDDDGTLEEDFEAWKAKLWPVMYTAFHPMAASDTDRSSFRTMSGDNIEVKHEKVTLTFNTVPITDPSVIAAKQDQLRDRSYSISSANGSVSGANANTNAASSSSSSKAKINSSTKHFFTAPHAKVLVNRELRNNDGDEAKHGSTRHIEIDLKNTGVTYQTADNLAILPENNTHTVEALARAQGYDLDSYFSLAPTAESKEEYRQPFPTPCSVRELLTSYLDIQGLLKHTQMKHLIPYVNDQTQKDWLLKLLYKDNRAAFKSFVEDDGKSLADVLTHELSSARVPLADLMHIATFIQPRYYTISSSSNVHPDVVHITVSITKYALKSGREFSGLCSQYLTGAGSAGASIRIYVRASSFRLPATVATPIIMIGPGTGLAPMRALLQERDFQANASTASGKKKSNAAKGMKNILFFGCKNKNIDYIYRDDLEEYESKNVITSYYQAFSRDAPEKVYVQHLIAQPVVAQQLIDALFSEEAYVYVCGATNMGTDVHLAFVNILVNQRGMSSAAATAYVKDLQERGRYVQELWTA